MWVKQCHKPSPSHHHCYRYGYHFPMGGLWILRWGTNPNKNNTVEIDWVVIEMLNIIYWLGIYWLPFFGEPRLTPAAVLRPWTQLLGVKRPQAPSPETARHPAHVTRPPEKTLQKPGSLQKLLEAAWGWGTGAAKQGALGADFSGSVESLKVAGGQGWRWRSWLRCIDMQFRWRTGWVTVTGSFIQLPYIVVLLGIHWAMQWDASKTGMMQRKGQASEWHTTFVLDDRFHQASVFVFIYFSGVQLLRFGRDQGANNFQSCLLIFLAPESKPNSQTMPYQ